MHKEVHYQYKKNQIEGVDQGKMIIMLYDGAIKFLNFASEALERKDMETAHNNLIRGQAIITELINSLKVDAGEVAVNLMRLYEFMNKQISIANAKKDKKIIQEVIGLLSSLKDGWIAAIVKWSEESSGKEKEASTEEKKPQVNVAV